MMKARGRAFLVVGLAGSLLAVAGALMAQDRAHQLAQQAASQHAAKCPGGLTLQQCHDKFPDGCSDAKIPAYDGYLDFLKDQDPDPGLASMRVLAAADFQKLESQLSQLKGGSGKKSQKLNATNHSTFANQLASLGEGNIYTVIGYLYFAEDTGAGNPPNVETCNCKLTAAGTFDYHIGIGFDANLASQAGAKHPQEGDPLLTQLEKNSVVVEMTPYTRSTRHPNWTIGNVQALQGKQVKVVGQLMVDNEHWVAKADCGFPGATAACWRSTVWEIHPVMKMFQCNVSSGCDASSPDTAWTDLDNVP